MFKRGGFLLVFFLFAILLGIINAQEDSTTDISTIDENAELEETEGITPDSIFYPVDKFFDNFADDIRVRQEAVAEIRAMIEEEKYEDALEALEKYKKHAGELEKEVSPEQRDEARRSAAAIYNVLKSLETQIPDEYKEDFFDDIIERERRIVIAVEIAGKIKELCEELSELDPLQYSRVCKTNDDAPKWHKDLDDRLTDEQRQEAEDFFDIMLQCFETSGETCRCEDISIESFANKCSQIAPLAYACDVENDEAACDRMDEIEDEEPIEDLLPDYLRDVLRQIEDRFEDEQFDNHAPRECREAGATTRIECMNVMFRLDAPQECVEALERGEISLDNEREAREGCERIMFDLEAPFECKEAGLTDFRECGKLMFRFNAPQECLDAGLTGENRGDERECRKIVGDDFGDHRGTGPAGYIDFNCREIENPEERLNCFDRVATQVDSQHGGFDDSNYDGPCFTNDDWESKKQECRNLYGEHAGDEPVYGNSGEGYECVIDVKCVDFGQYKENPWEGCEALYCGSGAYCEYGVCIPFEDNMVKEEPPYDCALLDCFEGYYCDPYSGCIPFEEPIPQPTLPEIVPPECGTGEFIECIENVCKCVTETTPKSIPEEPTTTDTTTDTTTITTEPEEPTTEPSPTGAVITGNAFLDYYFR